MKVELNDETIDELVKAVLKEHIDITRENIERLKNQKNLPTHLQADLGADVVNLDAMEIVYAYFGGVV